MKNAIISLLIFFQMVFLVPTAIGSVDASPYHVLDITFRTAIRTYNSVSKYCNSNFKDISTEDVFKLVDKECKNFASKISANHSAPNDKTNQTISEFNDNNTQTLNLSNKDNINMIVNVSASALKALIIKLSGTPLEFTTTIKSDASAAIQSSLASTAVGGQYQNPYTVFGITCLISMTSFNKVFSSRKDNSKIILEEDTYKQVGEKCKYSAETICYNIPLYKNSTYNDIFQTISELSDRFDNENTHTLDLSNNDNIQMITCIAALAVNKLILKFSGSQSELTTSIKPVDLGSNPI